jgi:hypothetical protein
MRLLRLRSVATSLVFALIGLLATVGAVLADHQPGGWP